MKPASDLHTAWARVFFRALAASGVDQVVVSPGSRSTPLALAAANEERLVTTSVVDERSAAFFALGQARLTGRPTAIIATSGSAGAHHFPAIVEASEANIPLLSITADRPWELQASGASQTIDQRKLFGDHARISLDLGLPDATALGAVARIAARAVLESTGTRPGPVHVNASFRKPLEPIASAPEAWAEDAHALLARGAPRVFAARSLASDDAIDAVAAELARAHRPILVAGPLDVHGPPAVARARVKAVAELATRWRLPVFAEPTSGLRYGSTVACAGSFDVFARGGGFDDGAPDLVLQIGLVPISRAYEELCRTAPRVVFARHGLPDPTASAGTFVLGDTADALSRLAARAPTSPRGARFADVALARDAAADHAAEALASEWSEAGIARAIVSTLGEGAILIVGNSLPPRDLDAFGGTSSSAITALHQRGAAGIDGLVAGAAGARSVAELARPVVLLLGDVSALHDAGSFALLADVRAPVVLVVVDNRGGRIFEELPLARDAAQRAALDRLFVTERPPAASALARAFNVQTETVRELAHLRRALAEGLCSPRASVLECLVDPADGRARRARLVEASSAVMRRA